jgi:hypothetical protein
MKRKQTLAILVFVFVLLSLGAGRAMAQTTTQGSIAGSTLDSTGAILPNATVKIVNNATNVSTVLQSGNSGDFAAPLLDPGEYTVTVTAPGFGTYQVNQS